MGLNKRFWKNKRVLVTGHTGFKGSWLCALLNIISVKTYGFSLPPTTNPNLFSLLKNSINVNSIIGDITDFNSISRAIDEIQPEIIIHMAAQSLVRHSYKFPIETYKTNVMGTINLFESAKISKSVRCILNVTSDKCYENKDSNSSFIETDRLGGNDPYSSSKACSEILTNSYKNSFFSQKDISGNEVGLASARAGNVIGGGDWSEDRLIPDYYKAMELNKSLIIRNSKSTRPWQYVLEPLLGYLLLVEKLFVNGKKYSSAWNFGPSNNSQKTVSWLVSQLSKNSGFKKIIFENNNDNFYEAKFLNLNSQKSITNLNWNQKLDIHESIKKVSDWYKAHQDGKDMGKFTKKQIEDFLNV